MLTETHRIVFLATAGLFGLLVGSFLNVCIFRLPRECMSIVRPRSRCTKCLKLIAWYDNFPVFSWLILGGKCRNCKERISPRYVLVELLTGALFAYAAYVQLWRATGPLDQRAVWFGVQAYLAAALIVCTFIDLDFTILPDEITYSGMVLGIACGAAFPFLLREPMTEHGRGVAAALTGGAIGAGALMIVAVLGKVLFRKEAMGMGDVKLMGFLGAFLGWRGVLLTFLVACFAGSVYGIGQYFFTKKLRGIYVPFGPFLALGALVLIFFSPAVDAVIEGYLRLVRPS